MRELTMKYMTDYINVFSMNVIHTLSCTYTDIG